MRQQSRVVTICVRQCPHGARRPDVELGDQHRPAGGGPVQGQLTHGLCRFRGPEQSGHPGPLPLPVKPWRPLPHFKLTCGAPKDAPAGVAGTSSSDRGGDRELGGLRRPPRHHAAGSRKPHFVAPASGMSCGRRFGTHHPFSAIAWAFWRSLLAGCRLRSSGLPARRRKPPAREAADLSIRRVGLVAGAGFEPAAFRL